VFLGGFLLLLLHCFHRVLGIDLPKYYTLDFYSLTLTPIDLIHSFMVLVVSGLLLKTEEFKDALRQLKFNVFVQIFAFGAVSATAFGVSSVLIATNAVIVPLANGVVICSCLPMATNTLVTFSHAADGDPGTALFNSAFGSMIGIGISPLLILGYLAVSPDAPLGQICYKIVIRVVVPFVVGQMLHILSCTIREFSTTYGRPLTKSQMYALLFIVYTVFCNTFASGTNVPVGTSLLSWLSSSVSYPSC
jgi:solute carrier family 10 (sodium/bile acid cotransporter), member 7